MFVKSWYVSLCHKIYRLYLYHRLTSQLETWDGLDKSAPEVVRIVKELSSSNSQEDSSGGDVSETHSSEPDRNVVDPSPPVLASLYCNQVLLK